MPPPRPVTQREGQLAKHDARIIDVLVRRDGGDGLSLDSLHGFLGGEHRHELHTDGVNYPIFHADTLDDLRRRGLVRRRAGRWRVTRKGAQALRDVGAPR